MLYAAAAVLRERGVRMVWWALEQRREWREKMRAEGRAEGQAAILTAMIDSARAEGDHALEERVERIAQEKGISLNGQSTS